MVKLSIVQQENISGGYDSERCGRVQYVANKYSSIMEDSDWELWLEAYDMYCL